MHIGVSKFGFFQGALNSGRFASLGTKSDQTLSQEQLLTLYTSSPVFSPRPLEPGTAVSRGERRV